MKYQPDPFTRLTLRVWDENVICICSILLFLRISSTHTFIYVLKINCQYILITINV